MNPGLIPPIEVAAAANRGLELREKFRRGGTSVGAHRARQLSERQPLSLRMVIAMSAYFARHEVDKGSKSHEWRGEADPSALGGASPVAVGWTISSHGSGGGIAARANRSSRRFQNAALIDTVIAWSIHTSGTGSLCSPPTRGAPVSVVSLHGPLQLLDLVAVIA